VIVVPASPCCTSSIVVAERVLPSGQVSVMKTEPSQQANAVRSTTIKAVSLKR
jgi:hypothetical protein